MYDASLGRWHTQDPLAEGFSSMTPYHYVKNNPVRLFDPNGMADNESFAEWTKRNQDEDKETSDDHNARFSSINLGGSALENLIVTTSEEGEEEEKKKEASNEGGVHLKMGMAL